MEPVNGESIEFLEWLSENSNWILAFAAIVVSPLVAWRIGKNQLQQQQAHFEAEFHRRDEEKLLEDLTEFFQAINLCFVAWKSGQTPTDEIFQIYTKLSSQLVIQLDVNREKEKEFRQVVMKLNSLLEKITSNILSGGGTTEEDDEDNASFNELMGRTLILANDLILEKRGLSKGKS